MKAVHMVAGGVPAALIAGLVATLTKGHVHLTTDEAVFYGGLAFAFGTAVAHRVERYGLKGLFAGLWSGAAADQPPPAAK